MPIPQWPNMINSCPPAWVFTGIEIFQWALALESLIPNCHNLLNLRRTAPSTVPLYHFTGQQSWQQENLPRAEGQPVEIPIIFLTGVQPVKGIDFAASFVWSSKLDWINHFYTERLVWLIFLLFLSKIFLGLPWIAQVSIFVELGNTSLLTELREWTVV